MNNVTDSDFSQFKQFYSNFLKTINDGDLNTFKKFTCDEGRIKYVFGFSFVHDYKISMGTNFKSGESAKQLKEDGNRAFQADQFRVALELYSRAIIKQPQQSSSDKEELSVLFANRSAALYHLKEYEAALQDIQSAFDFNYPSHLYYKVYDRKSRCFLALQQLKSARGAFRQSLQALDEAKLPAEKRQKWQRDIQIMLAMLDKNKELKDASMKKPSTDKGQFKDGANKQYPHASNVVTIKEAPQLGRFAEAGNDIKPGELLLRETPYCAVLLDQYSKSHCFQCFRRPAAVYPCPQCSNVVFCNKTCLSAALESHHRYECPVLSALWQSGASVTCLMALRIITQHNLEHFLQLKPVLTNSCKNKQYKSSDYTTVYNLVNHASQRSTEDFLHRTLMAVFLLRCLQTTGYFQHQNENVIKTNEKTLTDDEKFIGGLILRHLQSLQFNSHEVSELVIKGKDKKSVFIGGAVYPTLALFNHSCNPGIVRYHKGTEVVVRAIRPIKIGEVVAENYGPIFTQVERKERQHTLRSQYWFDCKCEACDENWPILANMNPEVMRFRCDCGSTVLVPTNTSEFMIPCLSCKKHANIFKGLKVLQDTDTMFRLAKSLVEEGNHMKALLKFLELLNLLDDTLVPPFRDYHLCQQEIRTCMMFCGNTYMVPKL
uniref:Protein-lysine N-methyltransferase SMYD4 n=2 Tax=Homalodisca liturata TaxID=320908 RepID=A0A1B6J8P5_9HEMI